MPLLRDGQLTADDAWVRFDDETDLPYDEAVRPIVSLDRFLDLTGKHTAGEQQAGEHQAGERMQSVAGVTLAPDDDARRLAPWIDRLELVCVEIPAFTDGRGYTHARLLREQLGYGGEIRATGDVRADQVLHMARVGIDVFAFAEEPDPELVASILRRYQAFYQTGYSQSIAG